MACSDTIRRPERSVHARHVRERLMVQSAVALATGLNCRGGVRSAKLGTVETRADRELQESPRLTLWEARHGRHEGLVLL